LAVDAGPERVGRLEDAAMGDVEQVHALTVPCCLHQSRGIV
jgi:hypothetical protein